MVNRYLEKIARNKFEQYLANKPRDAKFDNPKVQRAHSLVHESKSVNRQAQALNQLGADKALTNKYLETSRQILRKQRGNIHSTSKVTVESPFKNTGDSLSKIRRNAVNRVAHFEEQSPGYKRLLKFIKRNKGKTALVAGGVAAGAGLVGVGVKNLTKSASNLSTRLLLEGPPAGDLPKYDQHPLNIPIPVKGEVYDTVFNSRVKRRDEQDALAKKYKSSQPVSNARSVNAYTKLRRYAIQHPYKVAGGVTLVAGAGYGAKKLLEHDKE